MTKGVDESMLPDNGHKLEYKLEKDVNHVFRTIQRLLSAYKDEKRGPTYIAVQSPQGTIYVTCQVKRGLWVKFVEN